MSISAILANRPADVFTASPHESVGEVVARLAEHRIGALPVIDGSSVLGIFNEDGRRHNDLASHNGRARYAHIVGAVTYDETAHPPSSRD